MEQNPTTQLEHARFVSLKYFCVDMLGYGSSVPYYQHMHEPGWPQRVYVAGRPMLIYDECLAYQRSVIESRVPVDVRPVQRKPRKLPPKPKKRGSTGRPVKPAPA